jgi:hypothetical protein
MSDGSLCEPYAIANDLAIAAKNAAAELRLGEAVEGAAGKPAWI